MTWLAVSWSCDMSGSGFVRLARSAGLSHIREGFRVTNVRGGVKRVREEARREAVEGIVLFGSKVAATFGATKPFLETGEERSGLSAVVIPEPFSGSWWNDVRNEDRAVDLVVRLSR